ncbi:MAG: glycoside hydrolase family 2 TIM barrel-domain containing protein [Bacteroidales bacterium]
MPPSCPTIRKQAREGFRKESPNCLLLSGPWKFHWAPNLRLAPAVPETRLPAVPMGRNPGALQLADGRIRVPAVPQHRHAPSLDPPSVPENFNPVGSYYREFESSGNLDGQEVFLHFEGVQSAFRLWVNGKKRATTGANEPAEFRITPYLNKGANSVAVQVLRYADGSYLEDQDTWRLSGIYRDVYLMATPAVHMRDFYVRTELDRSYRDARLELQLHLQNYRKPVARSLAVKTRLFDPEGREVPGGIAEAPVKELRSGDSLVLDLTLEIRSPRLWSSEHPALYTLVMELQDGEGASLECLSTRVGFREVEIRDGVLLVNGRAVKFNGVNSHMLHPGTGHAMDVETMRQDLLLMKQFNINCVRTSHYPPNPEYLDLADELGMYLVDETGDEAHAYEHLSEDTLWRPAYLDRMRKMVYRDRNHPSVVIWSAGNESGSGENLCAVMSEGKKLDPSRPGWLYGGNRDEDPATNPIACEDIVGPRYLSPFALEQRFAKDDDPRPSFMDEYLAATGNSLGALDEYWTLIRRYPRLTGGAVWDWVSPGIRMDVVETRDESPAGIQCVLMNRAHLEPGRFGLAAVLSGHDDWVEVARDPSLDLAGDELTLDLWVKVDSFTGYGALVTKGDFQFGLNQVTESELEFYVHTDPRAGVSRLKGRLPEDWEGAWHHVAGIYDGNKMELYVDGRIVGTRKNRGNLLNAPYPVTVGKSSELRDSHRGDLTAAAVDRVRIFDRAMDIRSLMEEGEELETQSRLWLDFETAHTTGSYFSVGLPGRTYGLVWPDRRVQPELWQLKKSAQPVEFLGSGLGEGRIGVVNHHAFRNLSDFDLEWICLVEGRSERTGRLAWDVPPGDTVWLQLPLASLPAVPGKTVHLELSCRMRENAPWAAAGHEIAWEQFLVQEGGSPSEETAGSAPSVSEEAGFLVIKGDGFLYRFDRRTGLLEDLVAGDRDLVQAAPRFDVWRAPLANDLDSWSTWRNDMSYTRDGQGRETANSWRSTGLDRLEHTLDRMEVTGQTDSVVVYVESSLSARNFLTGFKVRQWYVIHGTGEMHVSVRSEPWGQLPGFLPRVGLTWELPPEFRQVEWFGRGPYENYPDRKTGAKTGVYHRTVDDMTEPYLIPQEYGNRCDVRWLRLCNEQGAGILISSDELFQFSAHPYRTETLDRASYTFQLEPDDAVVLHLDHRVSGVGETANSVFEPYRVTPRVEEFSFRIRPLGLAPVP